MTPVCTPDVNTLPWSDTDNETGNADLDANGLPWDSRIHSRGKSKNADGTWRYMRGIQDVVVQKVESELRQALGAPPAPTVKPHDTDAFRETDVATVEEEVPTPPIANDFPAFMSKITAAVSMGRLRQSRLIQIVQSFGLQSVPTVSTRLDLLPAINAAIDAELRG